MSIVRRRLSPDASRQAAITAARELLMEAGPAAVTLKAVAARMGRTHANLLHHFGSAAGLQRALTLNLAESACNEVALHMGDNPVGGGDIARIVDVTFDAFGREGGGALASWMMMTGNEDGFDPIVEAIQTLLNSRSKDPDAMQLLREDTLALVLMAVGDALVGDRMAAALDLTRTSARALATEFIAGRIAAYTARECPC